MYVRPIGPGDAARYESILRRTTPEDRYCRFFHSVDHFSRADVDRFVNLGQDMIGYIATQNDGTALGAVHAFLIDAQTAELAIVVAQDARRRGVGKALFGRLITELRALGFHHLIAYALAGNHALTSLAKAVGMRSSGVDAAVKTWSLDAAAGPVQPATADAAVPARPGAATAPRVSLNGCRETEPPPPRWPGGS